MKTTKKKRRMRRIPHILFSRLRSFLFRYVDSAGAIVFLDLNDRKGKKGSSQKRMTAREGSGVRVLMIQNEKLAWSFPKGHVRFLEHPVKAAIREVREETGIKIGIRRGFRTEVPSAIKEDRRKIIFYIGQMTGGYLHPQKNECMDAAWIPHEHVKELLRFPIDYVAYQKAYRKWKGERR